MEQATEQRKPLDNVVNTRGQINWEQLLEQALTAKGSMSNVFNRFHDYSFGNTVLLMMQGADEPLNTYRRWQAMDRYVKRGSKAFSIMVPLTYKDKLEDGTEVKRLRGFKLSACLFGYSQTGGEDIEMPAPPEWSIDQALDKLDIKRQPFTMHSANVTGYSWGRNIAVSPVDPDPLQTTIHEAAHILHGHTAPDQMQEYQRHRGIFEYQAEGTAYLAGHELEVITEQQASESRGYLQSWLRGQRPPMEVTRQIFRVTDQILKAGRLAVEGGES